MSDGVKAEDDGGRLCNGAGSGVASAAGKKKALKSNKK